MTGYATKEQLAQIRVAMNNGFAGLRGEIAGLRGDLEVKIVELRGDLEVKITGLGGDLEVKVADVKSDVLRWMFALFLTMLLAILGLYFKK